MTYNLSQDKPERYYQNQRQDMLAYIPDSVKKTLEIGCAEGNFSKLVKDKFNCQCWGIEINPKAAEIAQKKIDKVLIGDALESLNNAPDKYFDCVICNDILEHLADPYSLLLKIKDKLSENGVVLASIPNVRFCKIFYQYIIRADWKYTPHGILDKTHLRFFTKKSIIRMFDELGYESLVIKGMETQEGLKSFLIKCFSILFFFVFNDIRFQQYACVAKLR